MKKLLGAVVLSLAAVGAHAQGFLEFGLGQSRIDLDVPSADTVDDKDTTWSLSGGYMFHPNIGFEVGYRDLGGASAARTVGGITNRAEAEVTGFTLGAVGRIALAERFSIVPRLGLYLWEGEGSGTVNGVQVTSLDDDGTDIYFGIGAEYAFTKQLYLGAHWARCDIDGDDVDAFELRIGFRF